MSAGVVSGDLLHPLPFTPELHFSEFASAVADMKNSVAVSCVCVYSSFLAAESNTPSIVLVKQYSSRFNIKVAIDIFCQRMV